MLYENMFTIPDESLFKEGSLDPMGIQAVWSRYGQEIFKNKLNTISTDIRNYTINLFHHTIIRKLFVKYPNVVSSAISKFRNFEKEYDVKAGLLLFLEDILVGTMVYQNKIAGNSNIDLFGVLGGYKAELALNNSSDPYLLKADRTKGGFLIRQITLGINGRYKGPFINMELFDSAFHYNEKKWPEIETIIENWEDVNELSDRLLSIIIQILESQPGEFPEVEISKILNDSKLTELIVSCFGQRNIPPSVKEYWERNLGLQQGAVLSLYKQCDDSNKNSAKDYYLKAYQDESDPYEKEKIQHIIDLEEFLSSCLQIYYLLTKKSVKNIEDIKEEVKILLPVSVDKIRQLPYFEGRLKMLVAAIENSHNDPNKTIKEIVLYHQKVMEQKGAVPWVRIIENGNLERLIYQEPLCSTREFISTKPWYNNYYIPTLKAIHSGLNPTNN